MSDEQRAELHAKVDQLSDPEVVVLDRFVDAVLAPIEHELLPGSWLTTPTWSTEFLSRLRAHHALTPAPLSTTAFEDVFNASCVAAGWTVAPATSAINRFYDTVVTLPEQPKRTLSLKATSAKAMQENSIHISKLTEAAWVQDTRRQADRLRHLRKVFAEYRAQTDAIIILRCFRQAGGERRYQLVEIPTALFAGVDQLTVAEAREGTIPIPPGADVPDLKITVDRSDSKLTLSGIRLAVCTVHGTWIVPDLTLP